VQTVNLRAEYVKIMIYGAPGAGKTYLAGTANDVPEMCPVLWIDVEGGIKTLRNKWPMCEFIRIKDRYNDKGLLVKSAWEKLQDVYEEFQKGVLGYKTIVIDNATDAQGLAMQSVMQRLVAEKPERDLDVPDKREWLKGGEMIRRMVRMFRDLDAHVIFTAHEQEYKDDKTGEVTVLPDFPGKLPRRVAGYLDDVVYLYTKPKGNAGEVERKILCQPQGKWRVVKTRSELPPVLVNPTMEKIAKYTLDLKEE